MTQNLVQEHGGSRRLAAPARRNASLSLRQTVPTDWHHDRPAFAGDPYMDWESQPDPPVESRWGRALASRKPN